MMGCDNQLIYNVKSSTGLCEIYQLKTVLLIKGRVLLQD